MTDSETVDDLGYPREMLVSLIATAEDQYARNIEDNGEGKNWLRPGAPEARWHIWKACDELFQARDYAHAGQRAPAERHFADALNHMLMAMDVCENSRSPCPTGDGSN